MLHSYGRNMLRPNIAGIDLMTNDDTFVRAQGVRAQHAAPQRRSIRLQGYDYSCAGAYFITICSWQRKRVFGDITTDGALQLSAWGQIAQACWCDVPAHFPRVELDAFIVMPNHLHAILSLVDDEPLRPPHAPNIDRGGRVNVTPGSVGAIVRSYKAAVTALIRKTMRMDIVGAQHAAPYSPNNKMRRRMGQSGSAITMSTSFATSANSWRSGATSKTIR